MKTAVLGGKIAKPNHWTSLSHLYPVGHHLPRPVLHPPLTETSPHLQTPLTLPDLTQTRFWREACPCAILCIQGRLPQHQCILCHSQPLPTLDLKTAVPKD